MFKPDQRSFGQTLSGFNSLACRLERNLTVREEAVPRQVDLHHQRVVRQHG